jgi:AraC-like DNA-binding protein
MKLAKDLLLTTDMSVKQISRELGYSEENLFIKFFTYHEKISPAAFKAKYCNTHINNKFSSY